VLFSFPEEKNSLSLLLINIANMFGDSYTERKIDFVTGHTGSNVWDISQVTLVAPVCRISPSSSAAYYRRNVDDNVQLTMMTGCGFPVGSPSEQRKLFPSFDNIIVVG
jgi:hypothetical protein